MNRSKISVLKPILDEECLRIRCIRTHQLPMLRQGQFFYADYAKPDGFCDEAWKAIYQYAFALGHGAGKVCGGDWSDKKGEAIRSTMTEEVVLKTGYGVRPQWSEGPGSQSAVLLSCE